MIVLDASAALELLLVTDKGSRVAERIAPPEETLHAAHLIDLEVTQVLRRWVARRQLDEVRAVQALDDLRDLDLNRYPHDVLLDRIWWPTTTPRGSKPASGTPPMVGQSRRGPPLPPAWSACPVSAASTTGTSGRRQPGAPSRPLHGIDGLVDEF